MMANEHPLLETNKTGRVEASAWKPRLALRRWIWVLYALAWTTALLMPVPLPEHTDPRWAEPLFTFSKSLHIMAYALFTGLGAWMLLPGRYRWLLAIFLFGHAMMTEYLQYLTHDWFGRTGQWS